MPCPSLPCQRGSPHTLRGPGGEGSLGSGAGEPPKPQAHWDIRRGGACSCGGVEVVRKAANRSSSYTPTRGDICPHSTTSSGNHKLQCPGMAVLQHEQESPRIPVFFFYFPCSSCLRSGLRAFLLGRSPCLLPLPSGPSSTIFWKDGWNHLSKTQLNPLPGLPNAGGQSSNSLASVPHLNSEGSNNHLLGLRENK